MLRSLFSGAGIEHAAVPNRLETSVRMRDVGSAGPHPQPRHVAAVVGPQDTPQAIPAPMEWNCELK